MSESCLYLNVWAPHGDNSEKLPVLVWFHGGSFTMGGSTTYPGDGIFALRRNAILVTANYRLGALGWLGGKAVSESTSDGSSGNFGLQDTRVAMKWVQRNIAGFGGDPNRVTIFGESAGASLVETHLSAPLSNGLFRSAIMQSGAFDNYTTQVDPEETFEAFATQASCNPKASDVMDCLRGRPLWNTNQGFGKIGHSLMPAIANSSTNDGFGPVVDFVELHETPEQSAKAGRLNKVDSAIIGTNLDEGRFLMPIMMPVDNGPRATDADFQTWLSTYYPGAEKAIADQYSKELTQGLSPWETAAVIYTDSQYLCPTQRSARWLKRVGAQTFVYRLEYSPSIFWHSGRLVFQQYWCADYSRCRDVSLADPGVGHSADIYLLFNDPSLNETDVGVGRTMIDYWMNFAKSGDPSMGKSNVMPWPAFSRDNTTMSLGPRPKTLSNLRQSYCNFWEKIHSGNPSQARGTKTVVMV